MKAPGDMSETNDLMTQVSVITLITTADTGRRGGTQTHLTFSLFNLDLYLD